ncbi:MAG: NAD(P)-dependent oxidoreductase [Bacteroidia bacterium]
MPISVLLTETYHPFLLTALAETPYFRSVHLPHPTPAALQAALSTAQIWILRGAVPVDASLLSYAPNLRWIIRAGSGTDHIDKKALQARGIQLFTTPSANAATVAEYVLMAVLLLARRILPAYHDLREKGIWSRRTYPGREVASLTIGLIGYGTNGSRTAQLLRLLGARILAYDKYKAGFATSGIEEVPLEKIWEEADICSLHVPLTPETKGWVAAEFLAKFRKPIALINAARGEIVSLAALAQALQTGKVWGAALDTLPYEPPYNLPPAEAEAWNYLQRHPAVLLTPHIAGLTEESELRMAKSILALLQRFPDGHPYTEQHPI